MGAGRGYTGGSGPGGGAVLLLLPLLAHADRAHSERFHCPLKKTCPLVRIESMPYIHTHLTRPESYTVRRASVEVLFYFTFLTVIAPMANVK